MEEDTNRKSNSQTVETGNPYTDIAKSAVEQGIKSAADSALIKSKQKHEIAMKYMNDTSTSEFASEAYRSSVDSNLYQLQLSSTAEVIENLGKSREVDFEGISKMFRQEK